jgi:3'(2'), 5'-bisphosphate nucleotidase
MRAATAPAARSRGKSPGDERDAQFAARTTMAAGRILLDLRHQQESEHAPDSTELARLGRTWSTLLIQNRIRAGYPDDTIWSGGPVDPARLGRKRVWIAEPLDGTAQFSTLGNPDWSVQLALWDRDRGVTVAAVALPVLCEMACTSGRIPAPRRVAHRERKPRVLIDSRRPAAYARQVVRQIGGVAVPMGSTGFMCLAVVRGDADAYLHLGGPSAGDGAALAPVARAAGLHVSELATGPGSSAPDLLICRPPLAAPLLAAIGRQQAAGDRVSAGAGRTVGRPQGAD